MKIVAGLSSIDDYVRLAKAGADELFCGFVPYEWNKKYGTLFPINRREVLYYNVQINSYDDMKILKKMVDKYKVPVTVAINYLYYIEEQYSDIVEIMQNLISIGFDEFIIADIGLLLYLKERNIKCKIHLSGECAELNRLSVKFLNQFDITRYIFHRKNTIEDMQSIIADNKHNNLQYEAFILNERCHYTGAFCSSLHCDELSHLCKVPYEICKRDENCLDFPSVDNKIAAYYDSCEDEVSCSDDYMLGSTGCGICALKKLESAGVTHLKVVGRGNFVDVMEKDIKNLKKALLMVDSNKSSEAFDNEVKRELFHNSCSGNCYYK